MKQYKIDENLCVTLRKLIESGSFPGISYGNLKQIEFKLSILPEIKDEPKDKKGADVKLSHPIENRPT